MHIMAGGSQAMRQTPDDRFGAAAAFGRDTVIQKDDFHAPPSLWISSAQILETAFFWTTFSAIFRHLSLEVSAKLPS